MIPSEAWAGFDIRVPPNMPMEEMDRILKEFTNEDGVSINWVHRTPAHYV